MAIFSQISAPFQKKLDNGMLFPLVLSPSNGSPKDAEAVASSLRKQRLELEGLLVKSGAILLRGFEVWTGQQLNSIIDALEWREYPYLELGGLAKRKRVYGKVLTANDLPLNWYVGYHNEAAYIEKYPSKVAFYAQTPPEPGTGGATPIVPGHVVYKRVLERKHLADQVLGKGSVAVRTYLKDEKAWKARLAAEDKESAERSAIEKGLTLTWLADGGAIMDSKPMHPMFKKDTAGRMSIFTSLGTYVAFRELKLIGFPYMTLKFEDGSLLTDEAAEELVSIMIEEEVAFPWEKGDILLVDNNAVLHSRQTCTSAEREILVCLAE